MRTYLILCCFFSLIGLDLFAQRDTVATPVDSLSMYYDMSLEQLREVKSNGMSSELESVINSLISVASQKALTARESPSTITLVSEEEIKNSGARDLIDVLRLVPGFDFAYDGSNSVGIGVRGNWANEGKVLLLVDGVQLNDIFSGTIQLGNNFPISSIKRIEIIRGPGSAIYGGFAELGVINIITKTGTELNGGYLSGTYGQMEKGSARRTINIGAGTKVRDLEFSLTGVIGEGNRSDRSMFAKGIDSDPSASLTGTSQSLSNNSATNPFFWNAAIAYKKLSAKFIFDNYKTNVLGLTTPEGENFLTRQSNSFSGEIKYDWEPSKKLTLTPALFFTRQSPRVDNLPDTISLIQHEGQRIKGTFTANYNPIRKLNVVAGLSYFTDIGSNDADSITTIYGYERTIQYHNYALFAQVTARPRIANIIVGARYEKNSEFGHAFVPRVALTKRIDKLHFKLLYSGSFRAPTIENIARGVVELRNDGQFEQGIEAERTTVMEIETGYQIGRDMIATINLFDTQTEDPIVYLSDLNVYTNMDKSGSRGIEIETRLKKKWGFINLNYSFYTVASQAKLEVYSPIIPNDQDTTESKEYANTKVLLAFPAHKVTLNSNFMLLRSLSMNTSLVWNSERYGYDVRNTGGNTYESYLRKDGSKLTTNVFLNWTSPIRGLEIGAGVYNLFDTDYDYMTAVSARTSGSLPSGSREYSLRLNYSLKSK